MAEKFPFEIQSELHSENGVYESDTYIMTKDCINAIDGKPMKAGKKYTPKTKSEKIFFQQLCSFKACVGV